MHESDDQQHPITQGMAPLSKADCRRSTPTATLPCLQVTHLARPHVQPAPGARLAAIGACDAHVQVPPRQQRGRILGKPAERGEVGLARGHQAARRRDAARLPQRAYWVANVLQHLASAALSCYK